MMRSLQRERLSEKDIPYKEYCVLSGDKIFGIFFLHLEEAEKAARELSNNGKIIQIFEKLTGKVVWTFDMPTGLIE